MEPTVEAGAGTESGTAPVMGPVVQIDEGRIQAHLDEVVRSTVEETLNALLDAEADRLCAARKYERTEGRKDTRAGSYDRHLQTKAGEVTLTMPKLRTLPFDSAIRRAHRQDRSTEWQLIRGENTGGTGFVLPENESTKRQNRHRGPSRKRPNGNIGERSKPATTNSKRFGRTEFGFLRRSSTSTSRAIGSATVRRVLPNTRSDT